MKSRIVHTLILALLLISVVAKLKSSTQCQFRKDNHDINQMKSLLGNICQQIQCDLTEIESQDEEFIRKTVNIHLDKHWNTVGNRKPEACQFGNLAEIHCELDSNSNSAYKVRGVNMGGWLVLEPWIVPSLFDQFLNTSYENTAIDELTFGKYLGQEEALRQLEEHWSTWVTEEDFIKIKELGLNTIRIPFGWWILGAPPYYFSALEHLDRGLYLANKYGLNVLLDLHGAPGSQNGFDNSGMSCATSQFMGYCATDCPENPTWINYESNLNWTTYTLKTIAQRYSNYTNIWGIELINEPRYDLDLTLLKAWYIEAYQALRKIVPNWRIVMHDSFRAYDWVGFMNDTSKFHNVSLDTHIYFVFSNALVEQTQEEKIQDACSASSQIDFMMCEELPTIVGEFSFAVNDCARWLDGFRNGVPRTEQVGLSCSTTFDDAFFKEYTRSQFWSWERGNGWIFWNFKTESETEADWSYFGAVEKGWIPSNANDIPEFIKGACSSSSDFLTPKEESSLDAFLE